MDILIFIAMITLAGISAFLMGCIMYALIGASVR